MRDDDVKILHEHTLDLAELCRYCRVSAEHVQQWIELGILAPLATTERRFSGEAALYARRLARLERELLLDALSAAMLADLLQEVEQLRAEVRRLQFHIRS